MGGKLLRVLAACFVISVVAAPFIAVSEVKGGGLAFDGARWLEATGYVTTVGIVSALLLEAYGRIRTSAASRTAEPVPARAAAGRPGMRTAVALILLVVFLSALPSFASGYWTGMVLETLVYATIAVGLNIAVGMAGLLILGHAAFWAVGAYTFAMLTIHGHVNFWIAFPAAGAAAALAGFVVGLPALRLRGDYLAVCTLGFGETVRWLIKNNAPWTGGDAGIPGSEFAAEENLRTPHGVLGEFLWQPGARTGCYYFALALAVACIASVSILKRSRWGRAMAALREDETAARCMGIDTMRVKLIACMSAAMWAGLAGVIHPIYRQQVTPELFDFNASVLFLAMVVLGGLGSVAGSVLGAAILWILPALLRNQIPDAQEYRMLVFGAVMAAMMVVRPDGILGGARARTGSAA